MLIDCHTHAFSEKIAAKAVRQLIEYYSIPTTHGGELADLLMAARAAQLDALILLVAATKPEQVKPAHDWILALPDCHPGVVPQVIRFGTYHVDDPHWREELDRLRAAGIRGVKLHPEFQGMDLADPRMRPFFEEIAGEFILMVHVGDPVVTPQNLSTPRKVAALLRDFPTLDIIAAHLGGYRMWDEVTNALAGTRAYLDTSSALGYIEPEALHRIVDRHGAERLLCGSDYPLDSPANALRLLDRFSWLTSSQKADIAGANCAALLRKYGLLACPY